MCMKQTATFVELKLGSVRTKTWKPKGITNPAKYIMRFEKGFPTRPDSPFKKNSNTDAHTPPIQTYQFVLCSASQCSSLVSFFIPSVMSSLTSTA